MRAEAAPSLLLIEGLAGVGARATLADDEHHYLTRVCRARMGDRVTATDGRGALANVRVIETGRRTVVEVESWTRAERVREAWVLAGPPEGERGDWMVEKLAELGVATFQPVECERGGWDHLKGRAGRWRRVAVAALRQSRRCHLLEIREPRPLGDALASLPAGGARWFGDAAGPAAAGLDPAGTGCSVGLIGPASGLTDTERGVVAAAGFRPIALSDGRLRTETAALAWACWWSAPASGAQSDPPGTAAT